jgi:hypothetical protein
MSGKSKGGIALSRWCAHLEGMYSEGALGLNENRTFACHTLVIAVMSRRATGDCGLSQHSLVGSQGLVFGIGDTDLEKTVHDSDQLPAIRAGNRLAEVRCDVLLNSGFACGVLHGFPDHLGCNRFVSAPAIASARKQVSLGTHPAPVLA